MEMLQRHGGYVVLTLIFAIVFGGYVLYDRRPQPEPIEIIQPTSTPTLTIAPILVHVTGAVLRPGVYELAPESRLIHAVEAAGGMTEDADQERINLADYVRDGQQVYIPRIDTPAPPSPTPIANLSSSTASGESVSGQININKASAAELQTLPGIGAVYAQRIIAYREEHGPFTDPTQIKEIEGIGESRYEQIRARITVH